VKLSRGPGWRSATTKRLKKGLMSSKGKLV
jgi:hypothetical protein